MSTINTSMSAANLLAMRQNILQQNSVLQKAAAGPASGAGGIGGIGDAAGTSGTSSAKGAGFGDALKGALNKVNNLQADATAASEAYERGETTDIAAVMLSRWLIQHCSSPRRPSSTKPGLSTVSTVLPNSLSPVRATVPPSSRARACAP